MTAPMPDDSDARAQAALTAAERAACAVCADTLATGRVWAVASLFAGGVVLTGQALAAAGGAALCSATRPALFVAVWVAVWVAMLVCGAASAYLALRVALDARLFDRLARGDSRGDSGCDAGGISSLPLLDGALQQVLSVPAHQAGRSVDARIAGALRLWRAQAGVTALWAVPAVAAWWRC